MLTNEFNLIFVFFEDGRVIPAWQCNAVSAELNKTKKFTTIQYEIVAIDYFSALKVTEVGKIW